MISQEKTEQCKKTLYDYLRLHAERNGDKEYLVTEDETVTYSRAYSEVNGLITLFASAGITKGTVVALRATRCPKTVLLTIALGALGAVVALTDPHENVKDYIQNCGVDISPDHFITNECRSKSISERDGWQLLRGERRTDIIFEKGERPCDIPLARSDDAFMIIFTSGSTGRAKAVVLSHANCIANPVDAMPLFEQNEADTAIALLPLNHVFGFAVAACATFCGHGVVFPEDTDTDRVLQTIEKHRITVVYAVPTFFLALLKDDAYKKYDLSSLRLGLMAGAPFTAEQLRDIEGKLGLELMPGYGMSECVGVSTMNYGASVEERSTGVGKPYPMTEIKFTQDGEICVRGATLMLGYYNDARASGEAIDRDGFFHTGDLGYMDTNGFLHISGRKKDIIIRNGNNLSTLEIERKLLSVEGVKEVCVVGIADNVCGEVPCALIVGNEHYAPEYYGKVLTKIEMPVKIAYTDRIPQTSSGKQDKQRVRAMFSGNEGD